jgi:uncharacterized protein YggU (UPF0235/DUF167 family)
MTTKNTAQYIRVRVTTEASKEEVREHSPGLWHIRIREKPKQGEANARVRAVLARRLSIPTESLRLVKGSTSPSKTYLITNTHALCK